MIYLDHAATTPVYPEVLAEMLPWYEYNRVGNPGSIHTQGVNARNAIEKARGQVAEMIGSDISEVFFTSGGTESNNAWLRCLKPKVVLTPIVLTTEIEHHSVLEPIIHGIDPPAFRRAEYISVSHDGTVSTEDLDRLLDLHKGNVGAVSVMWVNNELGTINPIKEIGLICKKHGVPFHTDAVQAAGHVNIDVHDNNVDFLSLSGHKFGAPLGVGALYISNKIRKNALIFGGGQELGVRGGTENVPGIVGFGAAAEIVTKNLSVWQNNWANLKRVFLSVICEKAHDYDVSYNINGGSNVSNNIISLTIPGVESESLLLLLDQEDIYVSAGSACSAMSKDPSHVLIGIGKSRETAASTIRISMGIQNTESDMATAAEAIIRCASRLKSMYP